MKVALRERKMRHRQGNAFEREKWLRNLMFALENFICLRARLEDQVGESVMQTARAS